MKEGRIPVEQEGGREGSGEGSRKRKGRERKKKIGR
jgi:hypothetical protein